MNNETTEEPGIFTAKTPRKTLISRAKTKNIRQLKTFLQGLRILVSAVCLTALFLSALPPGLSAVQTPKPGHAYVYPSPASGDAFRLVYEMPEAGLVSIRIFNEAGDLVENREERKGAGLQESRLGTVYYTPGVYFFRLRLTLDSGRVVKLEPGKFSFVR